ncbi:DUF4407 domain-containing protein [Actinomadura barringtoniae]|uniref:DUF4407 domain-containing protein n=1 Tax=Actinomadura barringtoniae TaxID=1427535 RepID=A0A939PQK5_9ACTN|nr:DUF4407 domain-containing protein [Actinomadura barringtoniae]MBO2454413.1 DUF4407 domain-containing protein [Actinomadura barringtoniae]
MKNPLIWLSGADPEILRHASTDRAKYIGIGGAVLTTATLATVSMFFALRMAVGAAVWAAILLSLVWFLIILNLDRWLVVSLQRTERKMQTLLVALPRVAMALLFGVIISTPLTLQIFNDEVQVAVDQLHDEASRSFQNELNNGPDAKRVKLLEQRESQLLQQRNGNGLVNPQDDPEVKALQAQLPALQKDFRDNDDKAACELTGDRCKGTSGHSGDGPRYQKYRRRADELQSQINGINKKVDDKSKALRSAAEQNKDQLIQQAKQALPGVQTELKTLRDRQARQRADFEKSNGNNEGLLIRLKGLERASKGESQLQWARFMLFLFITVLECLPIIVKVLQLFAPAGAYDDALEKHRAKDRLLLNDHIRKQQGAGLRENSQHLDYAQNLERKRGEMLERLADRTIEAETRVHQAELERWEAEQMGQGGLSGNGHGHRPSLPHESSQWGAPARDRHDELGRPINARIISSSEWNAPQNPYASNEQPPPPPAGGGAPPAFGGNAPAGGGAPMPGGNAPMGGGGAYGGGSSAEVGPPFSPPSNGGGAYGGGAPAGSGPAFGAPASSGPAYGNSGPAYGNSSPGEAGPPFGAPSGGAAPGGGPAYGGRGPAGAGPAFGAPSGGAAPSGPPPGSAMPGGRPTPGAPAPGSPAGGGPVSGPYGEPLRPGAAPSEGGPARSTRDDLEMNPLDSPRSGLWTRLFGRGE